ncbi:hypothetical protein L6Q96_17390 [Candidatus Binatia bacterium]|nr:hypothetical protein [Candidatus Binatia bacterium]
MNVHDAESDPGTPQEDGVRRMVVSVQEVDHLLYVGQLTPPVHYVYRKVEIISSRRWRRDDKAAREVRVIVGNIA